MRTIIKPRNKTTMRVELKQPDHGEELTILITDTAGYELIGYNHDRTDHRCVIAFFQKDPGAKTEQYEHRFPVKENGEGELHTVTAIAVSGTTVLATDRKRIRSGQPVS